MTAIHHHYNYHVIIVLITKTTSRIHLCYYTRQNVELIIKYKWNAQHLFKLFLKNYMILGRILVYILYSNN